MDATERYRMEGTFETEEEKAERLRDLDFLVMLTYKRLGLWRE
jgi:hypothetical protein